jgi:hypothetical protein
MNERGRGWGGGVTEGEHGGVTDDRGREAEATLSPLAKDAGTGRGVRLPGAADG